MNPEKRTPEWNTQLVDRHWPWRKQAILPADVSDSLIHVMFSRKYHLEDVNYTKIVPNHYLVEIHAESYAAYFQPIETQIVEQWTNRLLSYLMTTNSRYGRKEFRFGGSVQIEIQPVTDLQPGQVRIRASIDPSTTRPAFQTPVPAAYLEMVPAGQRWPLGSGVVTLGREVGCDVVFAAPEIREQRLISGQHAYIRFEAGRFRIYDGSLRGKPSLNGTFVNQKPVPVDGIDLKTGDQIILAALDPADPRPDTPGVVALVFVQEHV